MEEIAAYREDLLIALGAVVQAVTETIAGLPEAAWYQPILPGGSTPHYILYHLCTLEEQVYAQQLPRFLAEDDPILPIFDDHAWMTAHYRPDEQVTSLTAQILRLHRAELQWLHGLPLEGWSRQARHPWWGVRTLQWWVELQLDESNQHRKQLSSINDL